MVYYDVILYSMAIKAQLMPGNKYIARFCK